MKLITLPSGSTLTELLVSLLFLSILMAISCSFARSALMSARVQEVRSEAQEVTTTALDLMARELRVAGYTETGSLTGVRVASADAIEIASDLNGDGDTDDANEVVGYSYDATHGQLMRSTGGASPQPLAANIPLRGVHFDYFGAGGAALAAASGLSASERSQICRIDISMNAELRNPDPLASHPLSASFTTSVALRNQCPQH